MAFNLFKKDMPDKKDSGGKSEEKKGAPIDKKAIDKARETLLRYKSGKASLEKNVIANEQWYKLRHWDLMRVQKSDVPEPSSAWLFNVISNKHADAMDNIPEPCVLPREESDTESAETLSEILPVIMERSNFEKTYSLNWWEKIKHGTAPYGIFWNSRIENGIGDIEIKPIDLLNIFWEPGISDIQDSSNLFIVGLRSVEQIKNDYPHIGEKFEDSTLRPEEYIHDENIDNSDKTVVVDWYYKVRKDNRTILHFCKFAGNEILFASENDERFADGWYEHGKYPVVFDTLFPEKDSPCGFGYIHIAKDPQMYIDKLSKFMLKSALLASRTRYMVSESAGIDEKEFADLSNDIIHCAGSITEDKAVQIKPQPISSIYYNILEFKTNELKETSQNRDVSQGSTGSGVTAAAAIAALQEAGNKTSRDMISASYNTYREMCYQIIDLIRQFYTEERAFRITGDDGKPKFTRFKNDSIVMQEDGEYFRLPIFDIKIKAQKKSPFSTMSQNEMAKELYNLGFFNPQRAQEALGAIQMMEFEGKDAVMGFIQQGDTLAQEIAGMQEQMAQMAQVIQSLTGVEAPTPEGGTEAPAPSAPKETHSIDPEVQTARTPYAERLAQRSSANMDLGSVEDLSQ